MKRNLAFIDGQNLHMGTAKLSGQSWKLDSVKLREYLRNKYKVDVAYYFWDVWMRASAKFIQNYKNLVLS
jgi:hypothetical protein